jgi:hypothetical protein
MEICQRRKNMRIPIYLCFIDLRKAFDLVPHEILIKRLEEKNICHKMISLIKSLYMNTKMRIKLEDRYSVEFNYQRGVRQGCPISPLLFDIYIDSILDNMKKIYIPGINEGISGICYADDTLIFAESEYDMQEKLDTLQSWASANYMEINTDKCALMKIEPPEIRKREKKLHKANKSKMSKGQLTLDTWFNLPGTMGCK